MENDKIEIGLAQKGAVNNHPYYSFIGAVLYLCEAKEIKNTDEDYEKIYLLEKSQSQKINKVTKLLEKLSSERVLPVYKKYNGKHEEVVFEKYNPQTNLSNLGILLCDDTPLYKTYNQYFYKYTDLLAMTEKYNHILNNEYALAYGYSNAVLKLMYEFSKQADMKAFLALPFETQKQDIITFAEKLNLKISTNVGEAIAIVLDGKLVRIRGANKK
ncbi:MAG: hypothetical protein MR368_01125 [Azospirillum sp.]|nr:hypothetical protein [Azospirillum sp.]